MSIEKTAEIFNNVFKTATPIDYNPNWANGTGYFDHAVEGEHAPKIKPGDVCCCITPMPNDRKIVMVGTRMGNIVIFQRYTDDDRVYVANMPDIVSKVLDHNGRIDQEMMSKLISPYYNFGKLIEELAEELERVKI